MDTMVTQSLPAEDMDDLRWAHAHLEHPSFAARLSTVLGVPIETGMEILPKSWQRPLQQTLEQTVQGMLDVAITLMRQPSRSGTHGGLHKLLAFAAGAVGGIFGPLACWRSCR